MATTPEKDEEKPKHRPIIRIGIFIIAHSLSVSVVCCTAGVLALLLFPVIAKKTYVSENALLPEADNSNTTCESYATNTIGIVRAQHGDGKEAIVLVTPYNSVNLTQNEALSLGIAYSAFSLLAQVNWLAKDIIWIAADSRYGEYNSVAAWLREYHTPSSNGLHESIETEVYDTFRRAGTMAAALVIKVAIERVGNVVRRLNPQWKFGIPVKDYVEGGATLVSSLYHQALGVPTGSHGAFRDYQIDAITMEITTNRSSTNKGGQDELLLQGGRLIETVLRSINNLLEKFHQSFFLYLLTSSNKFISVGVYMIAFLLLVAPLPVLAAALFLMPVNQSTSQKKIVNHLNLGVGFTQRKPYVSFIYGSHSLITSLFHISNTKFSTDISPSYLGFPLTLHLNCFGLIIGGPFRSMGCSEIIDSIQCIYRAVSDVGYKLCNR
ncbi:putative GPI transamidase component Gaa1 [Helianthus debilis subsp. tardiflorus]